MCEREHEYYSVCVCTCIYVCADLEFKLSLSSTAASWHITRVWCSIVCHQQWLTTTLITNHLYIYIYNKNTLHYSNHIILPTCSGSIATLFLNTLNCLSVLCSLRAASSSFFTSNSSLPTPVRGLPAFSTSFK